MLKSIFYKQTIKCKTSTPARLVGYGEDQVMKWFSVMGVWGVFLNPWGRLRFLFIEKGQTLSFLRHSALDPAASLGRRNPQLLQLMVQPVNQKLPKMPSPWSAHSEKKRSGDSASRHGVSKALLPAASSPQPSLSPQRSPSPAFPRPQCAEQSSENQTPMRQKGTAVCLQPLIQIDPSHYLILLGSLQWAHSH